MARKRTVEPKDYLEYLQAAWDPRNAAEALGCSIADIRALQKSTAFVTRFLDSTVGFTGPESWRATTEHETLQEAIAAKKFWALDGILKIAADEEAPHSVRMRALQNIVDRSLTMEGFTTKVQVDHNHTHAVMSLDPESVRTLTAAREESRRLIGAIDVTPEPV